MSQSHDFRRIVDVIPVRSFRSTQTELGAGLDHQGTDHEAWFVYARKLNDQWHKHCGPYSTFDQAKWWIEAIREEP